MFKNKVIVFGNNHHNSLGLVRSLGEAGLRPILIMVGCDESFVEKSKYIESTIHVSSIQEGIDYLLQMENELKPIIFCPNDAIASSLDKYYNILKNKYYLQHIIDSGDFPVYLDKQYVSAKAKECGLCVIPSVKYNLGDELPANIPLPALIKPSSSLQGEKSDIRICYTIEDISNCLSDLSNSCKSVLIQQYIPKEYECSVLGVSCEEVLIPGFIQKIREYPVKKGSSSFAYFRDFPDDFEIKPIESLVREIGYNGLFSVEFLKYNGKYYFLEINLRNDGNGYIPTKAGVNLPYLYCLGSIGQWNSYDIKRINPVYFMSDYYDIKHVKEGRISLLEWIKSLMKTNCFLVYNSSDPNPTRGRYSFIRNTCTTIVKWMLRM